MKKHLEDWSPRLALDLAVIEHAPHLRPKLRSPYRNTACRAFAAGMLEVAVAMIDGTYYQEDTSGNAAEDAPITVDPAFWE